MNKHCQITLSTNGTIILPLTHLLATPFMLERILYLLMFVDVINEIS